MEALGSGTKSHYFNKQLGPKNIDVCEIEREVYEHLIPSRYIDSSRTEFVKIGNSRWSYSTIGFCCQKIDLAGTGFLAKYGSRYTHYPATLGCSRSYWEVRLSSKEKRMPGIPRPRLASTAFNEASAPVPRISVVFRLLIVIVITVPVAVIDDPTILQIPPRQFRNTILTRLRILV
ncbi:hypothetical protein K0M31_005589 [Melipona bicolor]|uniref:Uncharacterized protein n=1 Tax=Melipona bicolor TaxID=60889 RepID=A0AA40FTS4_9HYME|nr:hypothetical protein K0M31_005589 [Melipona bicolor]